MALREAEKRYRQKSIKRIPLDMQKSDYEKLKAYCDKNGYSVNGFIKSLIMPFLDHAPD